MFCRLRVVLLQISWRLNVLVTREGKLVLTGVLLVKFGLTGLLEHLGTLNLDVSLLRDYPSSFLLLFILISRALFSPEVFGSAGVVGITRVTDGVSVRSWLFELALSQQEG